MKLLISDDLLDPPDRADSVQHLLAQLPHSGLVASGPAALVYLSGQLSPHSPRPPARTQSTHSQSSSHHLEARDVHELPCKHTIAIKQACHCIVTVVEGKV